MANKYSSEYVKLSEQTKSDIIAYYLTPNSKSNVTSKFSITIYSLNRILKENNINRERYGDIRNRMVSNSIKECLLQKPEIVQARVDFHKGRKRSEESKQRMREAAWNSLLTRKTNYISKIETAFGEYVEMKLGFKLVSQYRVGGKPFDFRIEDHNVLIEFDGPHHYNPDYYIWKDNPEGYVKQQFRDKLRHDIAEKHGFKLIVIKQPEVNRYGQPKGDLLIKLMNDIGYEA
jgi:very-short-patch-repair endonuclease